jgi:hypothetical protein
MTRQQRQRDQLGDLCDSGAVARAIDLAFEHFADFGPDDDLLQRLAAVIEHTAAPESVRRRFAELDRTAQGRAGPEPEPGRNRSFP